jgi:hypothetical protein
MFFFGTLFLLNSMDKRSRDALRVEHAKLLKSALDRYFKTRGSYPSPFPDNPVDDLNSFLVGGGYLSSIPRDPLPSQSYRYTTAGPAELQRYGLKFSMEQSGDCLTGVKFEGSGWWGTLPTCPF